ncbi:hypothetical protein SAMN05216315_11660 [Nitrosospira sp. Nsp18]|uniref:hypothetical protein n=1 Tax=Nitrosospira sp. Nsp18 TaxID=1855334 RepID=UPI0008855B46|nr:hypothetical protein [Nitrosospira sp. Nsp18]SDA21541.1 hypothetical protein SAMN05216315_11660 [Nitrosospira sp. Nsp18]
MVKSARREYLEAIRRRYRQARRKDKNPILDEFCANCGYHRKYAIRLLGLRSRPQGEGRAPSQFTLERRCSCRSSASGLPLISCVRRSSRL